MKGIATLIKLAKRTLDELRRKMGELENQKIKLQYASACLQKELEEEIKMASEQPEMGGFFGGFAKRIQKRQEVIAAEIKKIDQAMALLQNQIAEAFGELKKYEIAQENDKKRKQDEVNRKDTIQLDEIAAQQHRRKETENT
jgi:flagellar protein FliJ